MAKEPKTKAQFVDRMLMSDFSGDLRDLAADRNVAIRRVTDNVLELAFQGSGRKFQLVVRKPRTPEQIAAMNAKREAKAGGVTRKATKRKAPSASAHH